MTRAAFLLFLLLASSILSFSSSSSSSSSSITICPWTKLSADSSEVQHSFLRLYARGSARLFHGVWSAERVLLGCACTEDATVVQEYLARCQERARVFSAQPEKEEERHRYWLEVEEPCVKVASPPPVRAEESSNHGEEKRWKLLFENPNPFLQVSSPSLRARDSSHQHEEQVSSVSQVEEPRVKAPERAVRSVRGEGERSEVSGRQRVKRGFIVPGTLWCGSGNKAPSFEDLGAFSTTDSCCREHDQCKHTILSFHSQYGVFNSNIFTMSHCDCDHKFRRCLQDANDGISEVVGYTFFNLLKMQCFQFSHRLQCAQRNWFGLCKESKMALYAKVYQPTMYESTEEKMNNSVINSTSESPTSNSSSSSSSSSNSSSSSSSTAPVRSEQPSESPRSHVNSLPTQNQRGAEHDADITDIQTSCGVFKDLDECGDVILPQHSKYGLYNSDPGSLYHCNCTSRLFQTVTRQRRVSQVQNLLLGRVSPACFLPQDCTAGSQCSAVLVKAEFPPTVQKEQQQQQQQQQQQHPLQVVGLKVIRPTSRWGRRRDGREKLTRLCVRMSRSSDRDRRLSE